MKQVTYIRGKVLQQLKALRIYISMLPETEFLAMQRLSGVEGVQTAARIADFVLMELGHEPPMETPKQSPTMRQAKKILDDGMRR